MNDEPDTWVQPDIAVLDRQAEGFEQFAFTARRSISDHVNASFGKWATSPERGRFLVIVRREAFAVEERLIFIDDPDELLRFVLKEVYAFGEAERKTPELHVHVTPELHERFAAALAARTT
jgi:hypothetical protein